MTASDHRALVVNCTLVRSPGRSRTQDLVDRCVARLAAQGVAVDCVRAVDHDIAPGVHVDMTDFGWAFDEWPALQDAVLAADILVLATPTWLGDRSSVCTRVLERLLGCTCDHGPQVYAGRVGGCLAGGDAAGVARSVDGVLAALQQLGYAVPVAAADPDGTADALVRLARDQEPRPGRRGS